MLFALWTDVSRRWFHLHWVYLIINHPSISLRAQLLRCIHSEVSFPFWCMRRRFLIYPRQLMFICCGNSPTVGLFLKPRLHVTSTSPFLLWAAPLIFLMLCVNSTYIEPVLNGTKKDDFQGRCKGGLQAMFTRTINVTIFMSGTFDLFDVMYKQHNKSVLNPFLNGTKTMAFTVRVNEA